MCMEKNWATTCEKLVQSKTRKQNWATIGEYMEKNFATIGKY
jgi:hypothetical protein